MEFDTALRHNLPFVCIINNDCAWGMIRHGQRLGYGGDDKVIGSELGMRPYEKMIEGLERKIGLFDKVRSLNNIVGPDIIFECAGFPETFNMAVSLARRGGQVMIVSIIEQETPIYPFVLAVNEVDVKGCYGFTADDFNSVINYMSDIRLDTDRMVSEIIALDDIVEKGFNELLTSPEKLKIPKKQNWPSNLTSSRAGLRCFPISIVRNEGTKGLVSKMLR